MTIIRHGSHVKTAGNVSPVFRGRKKMRGLLAALAAIVLWSASPALAQEEGFEDEFKAFKQKIQAAKEAANPGDAPVEGVTDTVPVKAEPLVSAQDDTLAAERTSAAAASATGAFAAASTAGNNPLGPAANLPVSGQLPATAYAMDGAQQMVPQTPEEVQAQMEADMNEQKMKFKEQAFQSALEILMPLTPEQIRILLDKFRVSREAAETPITVPTPKSRVETVSLDPSAPPIVIRLAPGYVTTISILDMTGMPWAIQDVSWAGKADVAPPESGGNVLRLIPRTAHGSGNVSIRLVDLITPITFRFEMGLEEVDYRLDARIPKQGPLAKTPLIEYGGIATVAGTSDNLVAVLDGTVSGDAVKLKVEGVDGRTSIFKLDNMLYLRTPLTLLSPAWNESATSADGMNVYTLGDSPVILLSDGGRMVKARVIPEGEF